jgi:peptidoglycan/xylan/chitin deacetylase (PgdA/CDA1 family)
VNDARDLRFFAYSPIVERPPIAWPGGARVALWVVPNVEFYEFEPPPNPHRDAWPRVPHVRGYAWRDYGNRVGFWRMLEVLDRYELPITVSLNMAVLDLLPEIADAMIERDWEIMSHGLFNTRFLFGMSVEEERALIADTIETLRRHTGRRLKGMFGPHASITPNTMELMAEAGLLYSADWYVDDQPFPLETKTGRLVCVPYTWELNDGLAMTEGYGKGMGMYEADQFLQVGKDQFDTLYKEGEKSGRVMCLALHTSIFGQPHRVRYLDEALDYILSRDGVWPTTGAAIAEHYLENHFDDAVAFERAHAERYPARG